MKSREQLIHEASMRILERTGMKFEHPDAIKVLKSDIEWADLGDYYLALTFMFDMVDTELSAEFNIEIGNQMLIAYAELGNTYAVQFINTVFEF